MLPCVGKTRGGIVFVPRKVCWVLSRKIRYYVLLLFRVLCVAPSNLKPKIRTLHISRQIPNGGPTLLQIREFEGAVENPESSLCIKTVQRDHARLL